MSREVDIKALISHIVTGDGNEKCRICMGDTTEGQVYLSDTIMMEGEKRVTLSELLETITGVQMSEELLRPPGACTTCVSAVLAAQELRNLAAKSQVMWSKAIDAFFDIPLMTMPHVRSLCAFINKDLKFQVFHDTIGGKGEAVVNRIYTGLKKRNSSYDKRLKAAKMGLPCKCMDCGKSFPNLYYLNIHLKNSGQKEACLSCGAVVIRGKEMKEHLLTVHGINMILCTDCPALIKNEAEMKIHVNEAHGPGVITCSDCGRTFNRKCSYESHTQMHVVRTCRACHAQFSNRGCYREHRSQCEPNAKPDLRNLTRSRKANVRDPAIFICDYCGKNYHSRAQLKNHILWIHMDVRPHQCQWCGKRFYTAARLLEHTVVHTRVRNFECDICGAKLVSKMAAVYHRRRHTGEKPYTCEDCGEKFISSSRRSEHAKRKHMKGKRIPCPDCSSSFVRAVELRKHITKAHNNNSEAKKRRVDKLLLTNQDLEQNTFLIDFKSAG